MDEDYCIAACKSNIEQRSDAIQARNSLGKKSDHRQQLNIIVHCQHGLDPNCTCVKTFRVDKNCPLTYQEALVGAASYRRSIIENHTRELEYYLLCKIIKPKRNKQDNFIRKYESIYGSLLSNYVFETDQSVAHLNRNISST
ncbi:unnamed protein product [Rotaria socialis]|uniref:Uncharacterized protein n=1 Tax=Rotaria socialis TaxID=392032 RepID=A0A818MYF4_9BILA|nr:unnamed protein product [Rotaria socialis]CAF3510637.1 unnamed protein product [Rotaria socialis]CAF3596356.1 unnamed protein product [Rotaria socialis]CAF3648462.1 unnamed protein product [Rotaria socialis]CAF4159820.1 unnamed protein product [Rotaria socialis]